MIVLRILAQILIAAALMLLGADALNSLEAGAIQLRSISDLGGLLRLGDARAGLEAWDDGIFRSGLLYLVSLPAWVLTGAFGVLLAWAVGEPVRNGTGHGNGAAKPPE